MSAIILTLPTRAKPAGTVPHAAGEVISFPEDPRLPAMARAVSRLPDNDAIRLRKGLQRLLGELSADDMKRLSVDVFQNDAVADLQGWDERSARALLRGYLGSRIERAAAPEIALLLAWIGGGSCRQA